MTVLQVTPEKSLMYNNKSKTKYEALRNIGINPNLGGLFRGSFELGEGGGVK